METLNFKEIPEANKSNGRQDTFDLFTREMLDMLGFKILVNPDRGQDGGRDLIVEGKRVGLLDDTKIKWLVSCKHKVHSGSSVFSSGEEDIIDRVKSHKCDGFMEFYSTIVSSPLNRKLENIKEKIEGLLLKTN